MISIGIIHNHLEITSWILGQEVSTTEENFVPHVENYLEVNGCYIPAA
jgi:hypothetical protein